MIMRQNNKPYLVTTGISEFWDLDNKLLILGPWCAMNTKNKALLAEKDCIPIGSPFDTIEKIKDAGDYSTREYEELLPRLTDSLNAIHHTSYPLKYWRILIGTWLWHFIGVLYDRYKRIENAVALFPDLYTHISLTEYEKLIPWDPFDFINSVSDDSYNFQIFSIIINDLWPEHGVKIKNVYNPQHVKRKFKYNLKSKIFNFFMDNLPGKSEVILSDMYHLSNLNKLSLKLSPIGKKISFFDFLDIDLHIEDIAVDESVRKSMKLEGGRDVFRSLLYRMIPRSLPKCYVEGFKSYDTFINDFKRRKNANKILCSAVGWYYNELFKFLAAKSILSGTKIVEFQHGGGYGHAYYIPEELFAFERDIFYTWGWQAENSQVTRPMPSIHLSKMTDTYLPEKDNILYVSASSSAYHYKFQTALQPEEMQKYFDEQLLFLRELNDKNRSKVIYRAYLHDRGWGEKELIKKKFPQVVFLECARLSDWMKKVKLVVIDHPATSFLEALAINVPTILYWDHNIHALRKEARPYFDNLREAGILHMDAVSAAKMVNEISDDPLAWWSSTKVRSKKNNFCKRFAFVRKDWLNLWTEELSRIST